MDNRKMEKCLRKKSGFTLIEVILVVVIIGIISGVFLKGLNIGGKTDQAKKTEAIATIAILSGAIQEYEIMNGNYPSTLEGLNDESKGGPFLQKKVIPKDPWDKAYVYAAPGAHNNHTFDLSATAPDGKVINNWE